MSHFETRRLYFVSSAVLALGGLQLSLLGLGRLHDFVAGFAFNACFLLLLWLSFELCTGLLGQRAWLTLPLYPVVVGLSVLVFAHTWFFDVAIERRLTVFDMTGAGLRYFFELALPVSGRYALLALLLGMVVPVAVLARFRSVPRSLPRRWLWAVLLVPVSCIPPLAAAERVPSPLFDSTNELWQLATRPSIQASTQLVAPRWLAMLDKHAVTLATPPARYRKVIVLVMETMTARNFQRESSALSPHTFVRAERANTRRFTRYFPNNQDSRTGMLDMLFSRLVPYEAYSDEGFAHYRRLSEASSLVDRMRALSYASAFAVSQTTLEEVVGDLPWDATLRLDEREVDSARKASQLCFTPDEYETSCEDLALLPKVLDFVSAHERAFVYQEFIWGHAAVYNEVSGKSNAAYYSAYVDALRAGLKSRGLLDDTLIALTSDHGFRDKGLQDQLDVYRVPLLFHATDLPPASDERLLSHSDFGALLFELLAPGAARAPDNELVMIVGPTGQGNLFVVGRAGGQALLRHRLGRDLLLAQRGVLPLAPDALLALFRQYRAHFDHDAK